VASLVDGEVALPADGGAAPESVGVVEVVGFTGPGGMAVPPLEVAAPAPASSDAPLVVAGGVAAAESGVGAGAVAAASVCMAPLEALASIACRFAGGAFR